MPDNQFPQPNDSDIALVKKWWMLVEQFPSEHRVMIAKDLELNFPSLGNPSNDDPETILAQYIHLRG